jgi:hypothetical protein
MPLLPVDLQALFTQLAQVGKEQAARKDAPPQAQSLQAAQLVHRAEARDASVNETSQPETGPDAVRDRARRERRQRREKPAPQKEAPAPAPADDAMRDPALGRNVDVTG